MRKNRLWSKKLVIESILIRAKKGLPLSAKIVYEQDPCLCRHARKYWGKHGWQKALSLAGFNPHDVRKVFWTKQRIIKMICERWERKLPLNTACLRKKENGCCGLLVSGTRIFGSWKKAIESAGLDYDRIRLIEWWNEEKIIRKIKFLAGKGIRLNVKDMHRIKGSFLSRGIRFFGIWSKALAAAGIDYRNHYKNWSSKAWLANLSSSDIKKLEEKTFERAKERRLAK